VDVNRLPLALSAVVVCLIAGCGKHDSFVTGSVQLDAQPLGGGMVTFHPVGGGPAVYGMIREDGTYELSTGSEKGLKPGEYRITVVRTDNPPTAPGQTPSIGRLVTPEKYNRLETTDLRATIEPGANEIPLNLSSK
jgi:hypothetical protein